MSDGLWGVLSILLFGLVILFDFTKHRELSFTLFYLFPIAMVAIRFTLPWSLLSAVLATGTWFLASLGSGRPFDSMFIIGWTIVTRLITYGFFALVITQIHEMLVASRGKVEQLGAANEEKALLLRELNHRVKNSLSTVVALIHFEEMLDPDPRLVGSLERLQGRVKSMVELYDQLFLSSDSASVDLAAYLGKIADYISESFAAVAKGIHVQTRLEGLSLDSKRAISLGLVANELLTDVFKHAFAGDGGGHIDLTLQRVGTTIFLEIIDDGVGLPAGFDPGRSKGFGFRLVTGLVKDLGGSFTTGRGSGELSRPGARFTIRLPLVPTDAASD